MEKNPEIAAYWSQPADAMMKSLGSSSQGLDPAIAAERLTQTGANRLKTNHFIGSTLQLFLNQFRSPLVLILIFAAIVALLVKDWLDALIVLAIVGMTAVLSFIQEHRATRAVEKLRQKIATQSTVLRGGQTFVVPSDTIVPGDIVVLSAGNLIPADGMLLEAKDFHVAQALLTGETFPVEKKPGISVPDASLVDRNNCIFMGTSVRSGYAKALIIQTGLTTAYGKIAETLSLRPPETEFERGLRHFGQLLVRIMVIMVIAILAINIVLQHPTIETVLFALALAVGLSPELLPAILTITLARGAKAMAAQGVIVKRLNAIENLGSMDVLCTDKTGTLTKGVVQLDQALDSLGQTSKLVLQLAYVNSKLQTGITNLLDEAIIVAGEQSNITLTGYQKLDEIPYDFVRKRLTTVAKHETDATATMICKGAFQSILEICDQIQLASHIEPLTSEHQQQLLQHYTQWSMQGYRVLAVAQKSVAINTNYTRDDEHSFVWVGFLLFFDPPEAGITDTLNALTQLGVQLKIITGDNRYVASHVAEAVGIDTQTIVTGQALADMKDEALWHLAPQVGVFAEVDPNQKERIITALQKTGHVVGYLGDGINDAPALHAADVGISVENAADVAREAADFVLLKHDLKVLCQGIDEGRHTFANTLKYIFITTSANFGNMISMALASLFLPFLPLLAKQILLNNFLSDIPAMGIASDRVDRNWERTPHRWDVTLIRNFMITFGLVSVVFDLLTFGVLLYLAGEVEAIFRTGWFVESLLTELLIIFVIRTYKPFYRGQPGRFLIGSVIGIALIALLLPYVPIGSLFSFVPLPLPVMIAIIIITILYVIASEIVKQLFFKRLNRKSL